MERTLHLGPPSVSSTANERPTGARDWWLGAVDPAPIKESEGKREGGSHSEGSWSVTRPPPFFVLKHGPLALRDMRACLSYKGQSKLKLNAFHFTHNTMKRIDVPSYQENNNDRQNYEFYLKISSLCWTFSVEKEIRRQGCVFACPFQQINAFTGLPRSRQSRIRSGLYSGLLDTQNLKGLQIYCYLYIYIYLWMKCELKSFCPVIIDIIWFISQQKLGACSDKKFNE